MMNDTSGEGGSSSVKKIVVQKYGGSSVADAGRLKQVAERVATAVQAGFRVVVVVSAMGKTTDDLLQLARTVSAAPPRRELDMLLSTGERISMALLAMALHERGIDAISFTGSQSGILTNDRHSGARIIEVRPVRIEDELVRDKVVIVAGFQGMSYKREITTLGRGGSDTTAVALAAALGAESCEIYSDVDGVYSADPRVVPQARHLPQVGFDEMQELAEHGAKVLNAQAVQWARRAGIVIHARQTAGSARETLVGVGARANDQAAQDKGSHPDPHPDNYNKQALATAVTGTRRVVVLRTLHGQRVLSLLGQEGATLRHVRLALPQQPTQQPTQQLEVTLTCEDLPDWPRTLKELHAQSPGLSVDDSLGTVTAVGPGLGANARALALATQALTEGGLHLQRLDASPLRICAWLPEGEVDAGTRLWHKALIADC